MRLGSRLTIAIAALALLAAGPANAATKIPASLQSSYGAEPIRSAPRDRAGRARQLVRSVGDTVTKSSSKPLKLKNLGAVPAVAFSSLPPTSCAFRLQPGLLSITEDAPMASAGYSNPQRWSAASGLAKLWSDVEKVGAKPPTIAVVDTGVDAQPGRLRRPRRLSGDAHLAAGELGRRRQWPRHLRRRRSPRALRRSTRAPPRPRRSSRSTSPTTRACR